MSRDVTASFGLRLLHLTMYTFIEISMGCLRHALPLSRPSTHAKPSRPSTCLCHHHPLTLPRRVVILLNTPATIDQWVAREAAAQLRQDPVMTYFMHHLGVFHIFLGVSTYMLRDRVLDDAKVARAFYLSLIGLHLTLFQLARSAEQAGIATDGMTLEAGAMAAVFGGGAALALKFGPAPAPWVDDDDEPPRRTTPSAASSSLRANGKKDK